VTDELKELLRLYALEQECTPDEQARCANAFKAKVKEVAAAKKLPHWEISAYVRKQHEKQRLADDKRLGKNRGAGLPPAGDTTS
jgi:hypothetical protein